MGGNTIQVRLTSNWRGHGRGEAIVINAEVAEALVKQGKALLTRPTAKPRGRPPKQEIATVGVPEKAVIEQPKPRDIQPVEKKTEDTPEIKE